MNKALKFSRGNAKLDKSILIFSLPAGYACPFAKDCRSCADKLTGKIKDGPFTQFRCYATGAECLFPNIRKSRWHNFEALKAAKTTEKMAELIQAGVTGRKTTKMVRFHQSGDFFSQAYFDAWLLVAKNNPGLIFYGYTKALPLWVNRLKDIPANFRITASYGGTHDHLIAQHGLRSARVVYSEQAAKELGLEIDHDDSHCHSGTADFAILIHGTQPKGSEAGKAWFKIFKTGKGGYKADYFKHYDNKGLTKVKIVNGKHLHVADKAAWQKMTTLVRSKKALVTA